MAHKCGQRGHRRAPNIYNHARTNVASHAPPYLAAVLSCAKRWITLRYTGVPCWAQKCGQKTATELVPQSLIELMSTRQSQHSRTPRRSHLSLCFTWLRWPLSEKRPRFLTFIGHTSFPKFSFSHGQETASICGRKWSQLFLRPDFRFRFRFIPLARIRPRFVTTFGHSVCPLFANFIGLATSSWGSTWSQLLSNTRHNCRYWFARAFDTQAHV